MVPSPALPAKWIAAPDYNRLLFLAVLLGERYCAVCNFLRFELRRVMLCRPEDLPADVVALRRWVTYRIGAGESQTKLLMYPEDGQSRGPALPVTVPEGVALIGLAVGSRMSFCTAAGEISHVHVEAVGRPPLAAAPSTRRELGVAVCGHDGSAVHTAA
ncbi:MAG TPA: transcription elongation factor GreAB [Microvirga sp.]|nr:transcription elongation factor GreAB [Microvirga sp.]